MRGRRAWLLLILLIPSGWWLYHRLTPQSRIVFVSTRPGCSEIFSMNADGSDVQQLTRQSGKLGQVVLNHDMPAVSPDGKSIAYLSDDFGSRKIWVMDADGQRKHQISLRNYYPPFIMVGRPTFSADGKLIYYCSGYWRPSMQNSSQKLKQTFSVFQGEVFRVGLNGGAEQLISRAYNPFLACSHAGNILVYDSCRPGFPLYIYRSDADGKHEVQLTHNNVQMCMCPTISPDGKWIAFAGITPGIWQIFLMDAQGRNLRQLTHEKYSAQFPSFSPDGQWIAYHIGDYNNNADICTIRIDGRGRKALTHNIDSIALRRLLSLFGPLAERLHLRGPERDWFPAWGANPRR